MTDRIALNHFHPHPTPAGVADDGAAEKTEQSGPAQPDSPIDAGRAALAETPAEAGSSSLGAASLVKRHRAARRAMLGADAAAFAERFAHTPLGRRFHFIKTELERHPELADTAIAVRLQGAPSHDRALVRAELARTKATGFTRYAIAERVLAKARTLGASERTRLAPHQHGSPSRRSVELEAPKLAEVRACTRAGAFMRCDIGLEQTRKDLLDATAAYEKFVNAADEQEQMLMREQDRAVDDLAKSGPSELAVEARAEGRPTAPTLLDIGGNLSELRVRRANAQAMFSQLQRKYQQAMYFAQPIWSPHGIAGPRWKVAPMEAARALAEFDEVVNDINEGGVFSLAGVAYALGDAVQGKTPNPETERRLYEAGAAAGTVADGVGIWQQSRATPGAHPRAPEVDHREQVVMAHQVAATPNGPVEQSSARTWR